LGQGLHAKGTRALLCGMLTARPCRGRPPCHISIHARAALCSCWQAMATRRPRPPPAAAWPSPAQSQCNQVAVLATAVPLHHRAVAHACASRQAPAASTDRITSGAHAGRQHTTTFTQADREYAVCPERVAPMARGKVKFNVRPVWDTAQRTASLPDAADCYTATSWPNHPSPRSRPSLPCGAITVSVSLRRPHQLDPRQHSTASSPRGTSHDRRPMR
jgi:hypothetical protein